MNNKLQMFAALALLAGVGLADTTIPRYAAFADGLLSKTRPQGWLRDWCITQRDGLTGHQEALSYPYDSCLWAGAITRQGEDGESWWRYEQTAYYTDGLLRLGYALGDKTLVDRAMEGIRWTLEHASPEGQLGSAILWDAAHNKIDEGFDMWPMAVFVRAIMAAYDATGDRSLVEALRRYYLLYDAKHISKERNVVSAEGMLWAYDLTGDRRLLERAEAAWNGARQSHTWTCDFGPSYCEGDKPVYQHGVTYVEEMKVPMMLWARTGNARYREQAVNVERKLVRDHMLPDGCPSSIEQMRGNSVHFGHETCVVSDYSWTLGYYLMATGDATYGDRIERCVFNAGPGAVTKDFRALQYFSNVNQFIATDESNHNPFFYGSTWMQYRNAHETDCCAGNVHRFMPNYIARMWLKDVEGNPVAALYGPSDVDFGWCRIREETDYPFDGRIRLVLSLEKPRSVAFRFRVPGWLEAGTGRVAVNGCEVKSALVPGTFAEIRREFINGDCIELDFPMKVTFEDVPRRRTVCMDYSTRMTSVVLGPREPQGTVVRRGPLLLAYPIKASLAEDAADHANIAGKKSRNPDFRCWNMKPSGDFAYALVRHEARETVRGPAGFSLDHAAFEVEVPVRAIDWRLDENRFTPDMPEEVLVTDSLERTIRLVPYGATTLRLAVFPEAPPVATKAVREEKNDSPRFPWRGFMLDTSRHYFTLRDIRRTLDLMHEHGLNVFHWHLVDGPGWRAEIRACPELTGKGAVRKTSSHRTVTTFADATDGTYGPFFYTRDEMREVIAYAARLGIRVVPEVEIPGHEDAAIGAIPDLGCPGLPNCGELCVGNDKTIRLFETVLDEIVEVFPDEVVHIGGDECQYKNWEKCPLCQARMKAVGAKDGPALQAWVAKHFADYLAKKGRRMMGWDQLAEYDGLPRSVIIQNYRGSDYGIMAAKKGFDVVMSPDSHCYFDYPQQLRDDPYEYQPFGELLPVSKIATFDPLAGVPENCRKHVLGAEGAIWTELVTDFRSLEWHVWPRLAALAAVLNEGPANDVAAFETRMGAVRKRLVAQGVNAAPIGPLFSARPELPAGARWEAFRGDVGKPGVRQDFAKLLDVNLDESCLQFDLTNETDRYRRVFATRREEMAPGSYRIDLQWNRISAEAADGNGFRAALDVLERIARPKAGGIREFSAGVIVGTSTIAGTEADIQRIVDSSVGGTAVVPSGRYEISKAISLPSHTHLKLTGCHLRMKDGVFSRMFMSVGTEDVSIDGGGTAVLDGGEPNGLNEDTSKTGSLPHVSENLTVCFAGVKDFEVKNLEIRDHRWWGMMFTFCERGRVSRIRFRLTRHRIDQGQRLRNQDGIDLRVGCSDFDIEDISGETGDDVVAMTALSDGWVKDFYDAGSRPRDIHHIRVRRICAVSAGCSLVRLLTHYGQRIHDIDIRDIVEDGGPGETSPVQSAIRIGDRVPPYYRWDEKNAQRFGDISDILVDGVRTRACAAIHTDDGIRNLTVRNVTIDRDGGSAWIVGGYTMTPEPFLYLPELESRVRKQTFVRGYPSAWNICRRDTVKCENVRFEHVTAVSKPHFDEALFRFSDAEFKGCSVNGVKAKGRRLVEMSNCRNLPKIGK